VPVTPRHFTSLPAQVATALREEIDRGAWPEWLPGERTLTESLQVSRKTLRKALTQLQREGRVKAVHGLGNRIVSRGATPSVPAKSSEPVVALLTPDPLERMRPYTSLWVNHLKTLLSEKGARLRTVDGRKFFTQHPAKALEKLRAQQPAACWLLANSTEATQQWFREHAIPCVIAGSCHPGVDLPQADLDHYALCRHAAGVLLGAGHRRVALLNERSGRAGDVESEAGFIAGVRESPHSDALPLVIHHEHSPASLGKAVQRLLEMSSSPTALLVSNGASYLTVISVLAQRGLRVPHDISVVSRDDEPFLEFLVPPPTRYATKPHAYAKKLLKPILQSLSGEAVVPRSTRILPAYTKGGSLGAPHPVAHAGTKS
jgi:DNA-binding LacI/PurR family transcriptional regulator